MRKWRDITAGRFLRASNYELGDCFPVTIAAIRDEEGEWRNDEKIRTVLTLHHYPSGEKWGDMVPNITCLKTLRRLFKGEDPTSCIGKQVEVVIVDTDFGNGFQIQALRQQPTQLASPPPSPRPEPPAANVQPGRSHQLPAAGNGQPEKDGLDDLLPDDEIPDFGKPPAAAAAPEKRRPGRPKRDAR
jgi:hypothetical protein